jgi:endonuclease YncB( thermonuclease family)
MDLGVSQRILYESLKFARAFQILQTSAEIRWSHYRVLLRVPTKQGRDYYVRQTKKHAWSVGDLEVHVKGRLFEHTRGDSQAPLEELPKGRLYVYRVIECGGSAKLDLGFRTRLGSAVVSMDGLEPGKVAQSRRSRGGDREFEARPIDAKEENLFTYVGSVERVVDGDTLEMRLDLGFGVEVEQTIRLRGIDAPEMSTPEGERAREFVEKALKAAARVVITTRQQDRYRRWLADVYYRPGWRDGRRILSRGKMLNSELMEVGLASRYRG